MASTGERSIRQQLCEEVNYSHCMSVLLLHIYDVLS